GGDLVRVEGQPPKWSDVRASVEAVRLQPAAATAVSVAMAPLGGRLYWLATQNDGSVTRLDAAGHPVPVSDTDLAEAAGRIAGAVGVARQAMIDREDAYYFPRQDSFVLPVYRVILRDEEQTRYYLSPTTGSILQRADANGRWHRWLFGGLHRIDFTAWIRARPVWDILVLTLMLGGLGVTATGL